MCGNTTQHNPQRPTRNLAKRGCLDVPRMPEERRFADAVISATTIVPTPDKRRDFSLKTAQLPEQVAGRATSAVGSFSCYAVSKARKPRSQSSMCLAPGNKSRPGSKVQPRSSWTLRSSSLNCFRACIDPKVLQTGLSGSNNKDLQLHCKAKASSGPLGAKHLREDAKTLSHSLHNHHALSACPCHPWSSHPAGCLAHSVVCYVICHISGLRTRYSPSCHLKNND